MSREFGRAVAGPVEHPSDDFRFASAVAEFGLLLRDSRFRGAASIDRVIHRAQGAVGMDPLGYRADFLRVAAMARSLGMDPTGTERH